MNRLLYFDDVSKVKETPVTGEAAQIHSVCPRRFRAGGRLRAFTVVEILIVCFALVILAAVVVPQFSRADQQSKQNSLRDVLQFLRTQIDVFKAQHQEVPPGYPGGNPSFAPTVDALLQQMTEHSDVFCRVSATANPNLQYGPYISELPADPMNGLNSVEMIGNNQPLPAPDGKTGWIYKPQTQELEANVVGKDASGTPYSNY